MTDHIGLFQGRRVLIAVAAIGLFAAKMASLRAEVLAQTSGAPALDLGELQEPKRLAPEEIKNRGTQLRADLDNVFKRLLDSGKTGLANDLTPVFQRYIPAGMAFEDAEDILRAAGFTEPPRPGAGEEQDRNKEREKYVVVAEIPRFSRRVFGNIEAFIMPLPESLAANAGRRRRMVYDGHQ